MIMKKTALALMLAGMTCMAHAEQPAEKVLPYQAKPRVFVLSDIGNEPDDQMSLTRLLVYSNELDIEGLVATTSTWQKNTVSPDKMRLVLSHYAAVQPNLLKHDPHFPSAATLEAVIAAGQPGYGMADVGPGKSSVGAQHLMAAIERSTDSSRPLFIGLWGGANTLAQALTDLSAKLPANQVAALTQNLVVYSISDQDDAGYWVRSHYPAITYIVDPSSQDGKDYARATWTGISGDRYYRNAPGADFTTVSQEWLEKNIRSKGPMGKGYLHYAFIMEGDTPAFLGLIRNGLDSEMNPGWGGWGGRYILRQPQNEPHPVWTSGGDFFPGNPNAADTVTGSDGKTYTSNQASIWRWREAFQHDFAARMDWTIKDYASANHNPVAVVNNSTGLQPLWINVKVGQHFTLSAKGSHDPDGNQLSYRWIAYPEAAVQVSNPALIAELQASRDKEALEAPEVLHYAKDSGEQIDVQAKHSGTEHVILAVTDNGSPSLTSYRRVIVKVE